MRVSVLKTYIDANTGREYGAGDSVEYAADRARFLAEKGYVRLEDVEKAEPVATKETKAEPKKEPAKKTPAKKSTKK